MVEDSDQRRAELEATRSRADARLTELKAALRDQFNVPKQLREHPLRWGMGAATLIFMVAGGPKRLGGLAARRLLPRRRPSPVATVEEKVRDWVGERVGAKIARSEMRRVAQAAAKQTQQPLWEKFALRAFELGLTAATAAIVQRLASGGEGERAKDKSASAPTPIHDQGGSR